jgi:hypothetical protein
MKQVIDEIHQIRSDQPQAMAQALREVLADPATAQVIVDNMAAAAQQRATTAAGQGVWWVLRNVVARWVVIAAVVVVAAKVLGWDLAAKLGKWLTGATA